MTIPVTRDTWVSAVGGEQEGNNGAATRLKFKGIQEFSLVDGDFSALKGRRIERAVLRLHQASEERLWRVTVSTISVPWEEGTGTNYAKVPGAACFRLPGAVPDITAVILGNGGSIWRFADASDPDADGWQSIPVDPAVIQARIDGRSHGFVVIDDVGNEWTRQGDAFHWRPFPNRFFYSKDQNASVAPRFEVWVTDGEPVVGAAVARSAAAGRAEEDRVCRRSPRPRKRSRRAAVDGRRRSVRPAAGGPPCGAGRDGVAGCPRRRPAQSPNSACRTGSREDCSPSRPTAMPWCRATRPESRRFPKGPTAIAGQAIGWRRSSSPSRPGPERYTVRLAAGCEVPLEVWDFALPDRLSFVPQMNAYGLPDAQETAYYRLAHEHRTCLNCLRYSWQGQVAGGCARRRLRTDRGTGRPGTAASGRCWTAPPSPICPAGGCRSTTSTSR